jgi:hypothetical protein
VVPRTAKSTERDVWEVHDVPDWPPWLIDGIDDSGGGYNWAAPFRARNGLELFTDNQALHRWQYLCKAIRMSCRDAT